MTVFKLKYLLDYNPEKHQFFLNRNVYLSIDHKGFIKQKSYDILETDFIYEINQLVIPAFANAHSHAFQIGMRGFADNPKHFRDWVNNYLYPDLEQLTEKEYRKRLRFFFENLKRNGIFSLGEFHYLHHGNDYSNFDFIFLEEAKEAPINLSLLYSAYDQGKHVAQKRFHHSIESFFKSLVQIETWISKEGLQNQWSLSVAPHSLHGCQPEFMKAAVEWANDRQRYWHIHLAEQKSDIQYALDLYDKTPLMALESILSDQLHSNACLVHAVWLNNDEKQLFEQLNLNLIYNPLTNMYLGDGITDIKRLYVPEKQNMALGTDSNNAFNMLAECKTTELLQRVAHLEMGMIETHALFSSVNYNSNKLLNLAGGLIAENYLADFITIDMEKLSSNKEWFLLNEETLINYLIFGGFDSTYICERFKSGKKLDNDRSFLF